jgi:uncharacterized coiled-coil DUF342 family protein
MIYKQQMKGMFCFMKKTIMLIFIIFSTMLVSACSVLEEVNGSLEYVNKATEHISTLSDFSEEAPQMIKDAALDSEEREELGNQLAALKGDIEEFNTIVAPSIAENIHQQLVSKNEALIEEINKVIENGEVSIAKLEDTQLFKTISEVTTLLNQLEQLGL